MSKEEIIGKLLKASPEQIAAVEAALTQKSIPTAPAQEQDRKLYTMTGAAKALNLSRATIWRMAKEGRLATVETRLGRKRVTGASIAALLKGACQ
jgi:excisionase family DNA binding protein